MLRTTANVWPVITAEQLRDARLRSGYTSQAALAEALGVSERTVTNWEAEGAHVSTRAEAKVRALLWPAPGPLSSYSDYELLSELGRRLDATRRLAEKESQRSSNTEHGGEGHGFTTATETDPENDVESGNNSSEAPTAGWGPLT